MSQPATVRRTASTANVLPVLVSKAGSALLASLRYRNRLDDPIEQVDGGHAGKFGLGRHDHAVPEHEGHHRLDVVSSDEGTAVGGGIGLGRAGQRDGTAGADPQP